MTEGYQEQFIYKLEEQYGPWEKSTARFGTASYGKISKDLCISPSQFSKLIYGSATEGMYVRSIRNIERLISEQMALGERDEAKAELSREQAKTRLLISRQRYTRLRIIFFSLLALLAGVWGMYFYGGNSLSRPAFEAGSGGHPLSLYFDQEFDADFDSPYLRESEVQAYCPCSAYEGIWSLSEPYKLPLPGTRKPGVYYLAKSADVRMKCSKSDTINVGKGRVLWAYEYLVNEIWVDTKQTPLSPRYFDKDSKTYTPEFAELVFEDNPQFKKVATIHSFFVDKFEIRDDFIVRTGEPCGRFATDVDQELVEEYEINLKHILENVLGDLTKTNCHPAPNLFCDPNDLQEKESVIAFDCLYTIQVENLGIGGGYPYRKGYRLEKQSYTDNLVCTCDTTRAIGARPPTGSGKIDN